MHLNRATKALACASFLLAACFGRADAWVNVRIESKDSGQKNATPVIWDYQGFFKGGRIALVRAKSIEIYDPLADTLTTAFFEPKTYRVNSYSQRQKSRARLDFEREIASSGKLSPTGKRKLICGRECLQFKGTIRITVFDPILKATSRESYEVEDWIYPTLDVDLLPLFKLGWGGPFVTSYFARRSRRALTNQILAAGFPMFLRIVDRSADLNVTTQMSVWSYKNDPVPIAWVNVPKGYKQISP